MIPLSTLRFTMMAALLACSHLVLAQVTVTQFPLDNQLIARTGLATSAPAHIAGTVASGQGSLSLSAKLYDGQALVAEQTQVVQRSANAAVNFEMEILVPVTRTNHRLELTQAGSSTPVAAAINVVAGDVYVVNGQSNAVAGFALATPDRDDFLRGYLPNGDWSPLQLSNPGEWMGRAAYVLSRRHDVPIAVFNFAVGAQRLSFFMPTGTGQGNFDEAAATLEAAGVLGNVAGVCWFQGEADGWEASIRSYREELTELLNHYRQEYGNQQCYAFQTRSFSCGHPKPFVMEAQRRLDSELDWLTVLSTTNAVHDSCHYPYQGGYAVLGDRLADVITNEQYGRSDRSVYSPDIDSARIVSSNAIRLFFNGAGGGLAVTGNPWSEFVAEGVVVPASNGTISGNTVTLQFSEDISGATGVSYISHDGPEPDFLHGQSGVGAFTFYNKSLRPGDGDPGNFPDAELSFYSSTEELAVATVFSMDVVLRNTGPTTLTDAVVNVPLPRPVLIYEGGNEGTTDIGTFDPASDRWFVPALAPRDSAVLTLSYFVANADVPARIWGQLASASPIDEDSTPGNATLGEVAEDDEARIVIGQRELDCMLSVEPVSSTCTGVSFPVWDLQLAVAEGTDDVLTVSGPNGVPASWNTSGNLSLSLDFKALRDAGQLPLQLSFQRPSDATCGSVLTIANPESCDALVSTDDVPVDTSFQVYPNPSEAGALLTLELPQALQLTSEVQLIDVTGRRLASYDLSTSSPAGSQRLRSAQAANIYQLDLPNALPAGLYVLRIGQLSQQVIVR